MSSKNKEILLDYNGIKLAPCNYCNRKPGFLSDNINYCWKHWTEYKKNKVLVVVDKTLLMEQWKERIKMFTNSSDFDDNKYI